MLIPSQPMGGNTIPTSLSRRVNANSQLLLGRQLGLAKLIKKGEC